MGALINKLWDNGQIFNADMGTSRLSRAAFRNSLCTHSVKCRLDIDYVPVVAVEGLRRAVTEAVKYTENKLRALLGAKSRLAVKNLPEEYKNIIDSYFDVIFERVNRERRRAAMPEYEKLYDKESGEMSFDGADEIERISWTTTARLVSEEEEIPEEKNTPQGATLEEITASEISESDNYGGTYGLSRDEIEFIKAVFDSDIEGAESIADRLNTLSDTVAEKINEAFSDGFGDVIIEGCAPDLAIISDYKEDIEEWLSKIMK